jgi:CheY-like chemotaxis protein
MSFDLILMDVVMPDMDGIEATRRMRERESSSGRRVPIVALSISGSREERVELLDAGMDDCIVKPVTPDALGRVIAKWIGKEDPHTSPVTPRERSVWARSVLVVEDDAVSRRVAELYLKRIGIQCATACNGQEALEILERREFDLVLMDVMMPVMDGYQAIQAIRAREEGSGKHLPIITLTANALSGAREECLRMGADDYVAKPIREEDLVAALRRCGSALRSEVPAVDEDRDVDESAACCDADGQGTGGRRGSILAVEDNAINQRLISALLRKLGHASRVAGDGEEALEVLGQERFDLVLMDLQMPNMDGFETARRIRSMESASGARVPIVALTANTMQGCRDACLDAGMDDFMRKPVKPEDLRAVLDHWLTPGLVPGPGAPAPQAGPLPSDLA